MNFHIDVVQLMGSKRVCRLFTSPLNFLYPLLRVLIIPTIPHTVLQAGIFFEKFVFDLFRFGIVQVDVDL